MATKKQVPTSQSRAGRRIERPPLLSSCAYSSPWLDFCSDGSRASSLVYRICAIVSSHRTVSRTGTDCLDQTRFGEVDPTSVTGYRIPTIRSALIVAFMGLGALFGSLMAGRISSKTGIKVAFLSATLVYAIGAAIETSAQHSWVQILIGRLVTGYGVGALSMLAPLFQAEVRTCLVPTRSSLTSSPVLS